MKKLGIFLVLGLSCICLNAVEIANNHRSDFQIVYATDSGNKALDRFVKLGAQVVQSAIFKAAGVQLPLLAETQYNSRRPTIFVGNGRWQKTAGLSSADFASWEHAIVQKGRHVYLYGKDLPNPLKGDRFPAYFVRFMLGSLKASCTFVEKFANTRFVGPKHNAYGLHDGVRTLTQKRIAVPDNYSYRLKPKYTHADGDKGGVLYCVANNFYFSYGERYDVHWPTFAIPTEKYYAEHPEYFALYKGKRLKRYGNPQHCFSNPEVKKLLYQDALRRADQGFRVVELGQSDGFIPCECPNCQKLYNTRDWGEKLWCFNRDLAAWLQKKRPGVQVAIACYGPTHQVPRSFDRFPGPGVIIDVAPATPKLIQEWKKFNVISMAAWTYDFGCYLHCGFSPGPSFKKLQEAAKFYRATPVHCFFTCGLKHVPNLGGPWIYAWGKLCDDPQVNWSELLQDYCRFSFGEKAAGDFVQFFQLLDDRLNAVPLPKNEDFNNLNQRYAYTSELFWSRRYPESVVKTLQRHFQNGLNKCDPHNSMLKGLKLEFEYLVLTARMSQLLVKFEKAPLSDLRFELADALDARNKFINSLKLRFDGRATEAFNWVKPSFLRQGGHMAGKFRNNVEIDTKLLRQRINRVTAVPVKDFADPAWEKIPVQKLTGFKKYAKPSTATFQLGYNDRNLLLKIKAPATPVVVKKLPRDDGRMWQNAVNEIMIANGRYIVHLVFDQNPGSAYDSIIFNRENKKWNYPKWQHRDEVKSGVWSSEVTIPLAALGGKPRFEQWQMQVGYSSPGAQELYAWNVPLSETFIDVKGFGDIYFQPLDARPKERIIPINGKWQQGTKNWRVSTPKFPLKVISDSGRSALLLEVKTPTYSRISTTSNYGINSDETAQITFKVRGSGRVIPGVGWCDVRGHWVSNDFRPIVNLTAQTQTLTYNFKIGQHQLKGGRNFCIVLLVPKPGGRLLVDEVELKILRH